MGWQQIIAGLMVLAAATYAARKLGPKAWRFKGRAASAGTAGGEECGCRKEGNGCH